VGSPNIIPNPKLPFARVELEAKIKTNNKKTRKYFMAFPI
jgi:hypothetical protein